MSLDILDSLNSVFGSPLLKQLGTSLGESEDTTRNALRSVGPTMLAGVMGKAFSGGAGDLLRAFNDERIDSGIVGKLGSLLTNSGSMSSLAGLGESLARNVFGQRSSSVTNALSQVTGVKQGTASTLLSLGLPVLFGILKKYSSSHSLDAQGLTTLLASQKASLQRSGLDDRITGALGFPNLSSLLNLVPGTRPAAASAPVEKKRAAWFPWAIAAGVGAIALLSFLNLNRADRSTLVPTTADNTAQVFFDSGETNVDTRDRVQIASIAQTARQQNRDVKVTGYTDTTGSVDQNLEVAKGRALSVRDALVAEGVPEDKILMEPPATVTGTGTSDQARRVDIALR